MDAHRTALWGFGVVLALVLLTPLAHAVSYHSHVLPILKANCQGCHNPADADGDFVLTTYDKLMAGGSEGVAIVPGDPDESLLIDAVIGDDPWMPKGNDPLTAEQIDLLRAWIAEGAVDDTPVVADSISALEPPVYNAAPVISALAYSPDGETLAVSGYREILLHKSDGSKLLGRLVGESHRIEALAYSEDGAVLVASGGSPAQFGEVQLWDTASHTPIRTVRTTYDTVYGVSVSGDASLVAIGCGDNTARVLSAADGAERIRFENHGDWVFGTVFSTDSTHVVTAGRDGALKLIRVEDGAFVDDINASNKGYGGVNCIARHPSEDQVLSAGDDRIPRLYRIFRTTRRDVGNTDFNLIRAFEAQGAPVTAVAFSPDGERVAIGSAAGEVRVYNVSDGTRLSTVTGDAIGVFALAFHPDGKQLAAAGFEGEVRLFDAESGNAIRSFTPVPLTGTSKRAAGASDETTSDETSG
jgi:WD40 repeat protein